MISTVSGNQSERLNSVTDSNVDWFSIKLYCFQSVRLIFGLIWQFMTYYINVSMIGTALCKIYIMPMLINVYDSSIGLYCVVLTLQLPYITIVHQQSYSILIYWYLIGMQVQMLKIDPCIAIHDSHILSCNAVSMSHNSVLCLTVYRSTIKIFKYTSLSGTTTIILYWLIDLLICPHVNLTNDWSMHCNLPSITNPTIVHTEPSHPLCRTCVIAYST